MSLDSKQQAAVGAPHYLGVNVDTSSVCTFKSTFWITCLRIEKVRMAGKQTSKLQLYREYRYEASLWWSWQRWVISSTSSKTWTCRFQLLSACFFRRACNETTRDREPGQHTNQHYCGYLHPATR